VHVYKVYATEEVTSDYNIRSIKLKDRVLIYLDGQPVAEVKGQWPASRVGIISSNTQFSFNGITLFEKN
jgi:hypothetical protein